MGGGGIEAHWQVGQGDRERGGGEEGLGLGQRDPEGETGGRADKERGETGREEDSLLGETAKEGEALPEGEQGMGEMAMGTRSRLVGAVAVSEGAVV